MVSTGRGRGKAGDCIGACVDAMCKGCIGACAEAFFDVAPPWLQALVMAIGGGGAIYGMIVTIVSIASYESASLTNTTNATAAVATSCLWELATTPLQPATLFMTCGSSLLHPGCLPCSNGVQCGNATDCASNYCDTLNDNPTCQEPPVPPAICQDDERGFHAIFTWIYAGACVFAFVSTCLCPELLGPPTETDVFNPIVAPIFLLLSGSFLGACLNQNESMYMARGITMAVFFAFLICPLLMGYSSDLSEANADNWGLSSGGRDLAMVTFWGILGFGDLYLSFMSMKPAASNLPLDHYFSDITAHERCGDWEQKFYGSVMACSSLLCILTFIRASRIMQTNSEAHQHHGQNSGYGINPDDIVNLKYRLGATWMVLVPLCLVVVIAEFCLASCRHTGLTQLTPWSICLVVAFHLSTVAPLVRMCVMRSDSTSDTEFFEASKIVSQQDQACRERRVFYEARARGERQASIDANELVQLRREVLTAAAPDQTLKLRVNFFPGEMSESSVELCINRETSPLELVALLGDTLVRPEHAMSRPLEFTMGGISIMEYASLADAGVEDNATLAINKVDPGDFLAWRHSALARVQPVFDQLKAAKATGALLEAGTDLDAELGSAWPLWRNAFNTTAQSAHALEFPQCHMERLIRVKPGLTLPSLEWITAVKAAGFQCTLPERLPGQRGDGLGWCEREKSLAAGRTKMLNGGHLESHASHPWELPRLLMLGGELPDGNTPTVGTASTSDEAPGMVDVTLDVTAGTAPEDTIANSNTHARFQGIIQVNPIKGAALGNTVIFLFLGWGTYIVYSSAGAD